MASKSLVFGFVAGLLAVSLAPQTASACGFKSFGYNASVSYAATRSGRGSVAVYGHTAVSRRLVLGLRAAGYKIRRVYSVNEARKANVVLADSSDVNTLKAQLKGSGATVVTVLASDEHVGAGVQYAINSGERSSEQLAMLVKAIRASKKRG